MSQNIRKRIIKNIDYIIALILTIIVIRITRVVFQNEIVELDTNFYKFVVENIRNKYLTYFMRAVTILGSSIVIILICIFVMIRIKKKKIVTCICVNPIIIVVLNYILKNIVARKRPEEFFLIIEKGFSFPSGHSMVSTAFYGFFIYLLYKYYKDKKKYILIGINIILIPLIMFSRVYLGVHYLSDIIAGCLISIIYLIIYIRIINRLIREEVGYENKKSIS
ncbi:MAG: phosphatase PAP2 family protein [Bacilli bacterium]|nr:phosphatase PAP2 family protein [Bacilli bacterium]